MEIRKILSILAILARAGVTLGAAEQNQTQFHFHCAHCAIMASRLAEEGSGAPRRQYAPDRLIDVKHLKLEIEPDFATQELEGRATLDFAPIAKPLRQLTLHAVDLRITKLASDHSVRAYQSHEDGLEITFEAPVPAGESVRVTIDYEAAPKKGLDFRSAAMGYPEGEEQLWTQGEPENHPHWFPSHDYPNERFTTEMICRVPEGMVALSNGRLVSSELTSDR